MKLNVWSRIALLFLALELVTLGSLAPPATAVPPITTQTIKQALEEYANYPVPQALGLLMDQYASMRANERDTLVSMICFVMDDNVKRSSVNGANIDTIRTALWSVGQTGRSKPWRFPIGFTLEPQSMFHNDTTSAGANTNWSKWDVLNAVTRYGCDANGSTGYDEQGGWAHGVTGKIATGAFTSIDQFDRNIGFGVQGAVIDSTGLPAVVPNYRVRWHSWSNSSCTAFQKRILHKYGIEFAFSAPSLASTGSGSGERPNYLWPAQPTGMNVGLASGAVGAYVSVLPGMLPDRYEISQAIAETSDSATTRLTIQKCLSIRGSGVVVNLHNFALWSTNLAGNNAGDLSTVSGVMSLIAKYVRQGRLRVVTPTEFCENYYYRPIGPGANWVQPNFRDSDGDGNIDWWIQRGTTGQGFPNAGVNVPTNGTGALGAATVGYGGMAERPLRWSGVSKVGDPGTGYATDMAGATRTQAWTSGSDAIIIPGPPRGWVCHVEFAARGDTTKAVSNVTTLGDSIGVTFTSAALGNWNTKRQGISPNLRFLRDMNLSYEPTSNWTGPTTGNSMPHIKLAGRDKVGGSKYARGEFEFEVPDWADWLYITFWQGGRQESQTIRISNVFVGFRPRDPRIAVPGGM